MASHDVSWVLSTHVRFGNLDFIVTMEGGLVQAPVAVQPLHFTGLDAIAEVLEELQLHPSRECFVVGTPEGHVESIHKGEATPMNDLDDEVERDAGAPPRLWVEQLKARHQELLYP